MIEGVSLVSGLRASRYLAVLLRESVCLGGQDVRVGGLSAWVDDQLVWALSDSVLEDRELDALLRGDVVEAVPVICIGNILL